MLEACYVSDVGRKRKINQDSVFITTKPLGSLPNLLLLADGMGGHKAGDYASRTAIEIIKNEIPASEETDPVQILTRVIESANKKLYEKSVTDINYSGMGTTLVAACCVESQLTVANIGDSRLYLIRENTMVQVTRDHSYVAEMIRSGTINRDQAKNHPKKNYITRAVGAFPRTTADFFYVDILPEDIILICSDGLTNMLEDEQILSVVYQEKSMQEACARLVEDANENGGADNISVILARPLSKKEDRHDD
ncbi:MAG: Stp1/IreP family PP2C-type Ser/Thr phosphatase [Lachnospiraceae bacterium]|nr:Stp1/IreP family PP2C-type Ser/Thr phosphatase [Lachnospiraceae bacterium]